MRVSRQDYEAAVAGMKGALNYGGPDKALANASGGDFEDHYAVRNGQRVRVAKADYANGVFEIEDAVAAKVLPGRFL